MLLVGVLLGGFIRGFWKLEGERVIKLLIKWIGQLAAWEVHDLVPTFPGVLKKAYGTKPFSGSTVESRDTALTLLVESRVTALTLLSFLVRYVP